MSKPRIALLVGVFVLLSASTIYSLTPDRYIQGLPAWAKVVGGCVLVLGVIFEFVCAGSELKSHLAGKSGKSEVIPSANEKEPIQPPQTTTGSSAPDRV